MEIKINREIRDYTESMFFGLSLRQFIFFFAGSRRRRWRLLCAQAELRHRNRVLGLHLMCRAIRRYGLCQISRHDSRAVCLGVDTLGVYFAQKTDVQGDQYLL